MGSGLPWIICCRTISLLALRVKRRIPSEKRLGHATFFNYLNKSILLMTSFTIVFSLKNKTKLQNNNQIICQRTQQLKYWYYPITFIKTAFFSSQKSNYISKVSYLQIAKHSLVPKFPIKL